jgi:hypothetical protein
VIKWVQKEAIMAEKKENPPTPGGMVALFLITLFIFPPAAVLFLAVMVLLAAFKVIGGGK